MNRTIRIAVLTMVVILGGVLLMGATHGDTPPKSMYGAVAVDSAAPATKIFTGMSGRNAFSIYNNGPNTIWCGFDSSVTNVTGTPVRTLTALAIDLTYTGSGDKDFYCRADTALQVSPADTRWLQVK